MMSDEEVDYDTERDEEDELQDLHQLTAVLQCDEPCLSSSTSQYSASTVTSYSNVLKYEQNSKIEAALALNKMCDEKLSRLEKILYNRLRECRERLSEIQVPFCTDNDDKVETFRYVHCGKPYFKDSSNFPAPDNDDTIIMKKTEMYDFSHVTSVSGWTIRDKSIFLKLIHKMSQEIKKMKLHSEIAELKRKSKITPCKVTETQIETLRKMISKVSAQPLQEVALPIDEDYDWYAIANKLNKRHTASEYRALWKLFLHPSINKTTWNKTEHQSLQKIAYEEKLQDWDKIAERLNTQRTSYQCFVYFRTNMSNTFTGRKWSNEEVEYLKRLIEYFREDDYIPWGRVASSMENRTKIQIYNKYLTMCEQRKGRFLPEEDAVILTCAENFGHNFHEMAKYLPGRSSSQCRVRYNVLAKKRISTVWTVEEDRRLIQLMANQDSIINYSCLAKYFPGKDRVHIRARNIILTKWMRRNPNVDIAKAPRRGARRLGHGQQSDDLNKAIENLKDRIQSEVNSIRSKKISKDSPENMIDDAIVACLVTEQARLEEANRCIEEYSDSFIEASTTSKDFNLRNLRKVLIFLKAKLNRNKFESSSICNKYGGLLNNDEEIQTVKLKSYSKKETVRNFVVNGPPDVWGNGTLGTLECVFPPHYATITGCRKLMSYLSSKPKNEDVLYIKRILRLNPRLREQYALLMERFNALFLWPLLISNTPPEPTLLNTPGTSSVRHTRIERIGSESDEDDIDMAKNIKPSSINEANDWAQTEPSHTLEGDNKKLKID